STRPHALAMTGWSSTTRMPPKVFSPGVTGLAAYADKHKGEPTVFLSRLARVGKIYLFSRNFSGFFPNGAGTFSHDRTGRIQQSEVGGDRRAEGEKKTRPARRGSRRGQCVRVVLARGVVVRSLASRRLLLGYR